MPLLLLLLLAGGLIASSTPAHASPGGGGGGGGGALAGGEKLLQGLTPDTIAFVLEVARRARLEGITIRLVSGKRSCAQQNALYAQGRTAPGPIVTGARGCRSWHVQGRAVDFEPQPRTQASYARVGAIAVELGGVWGGQFSNLNDIGHVEFHPGLKIEQVCPNPDDCK